MAPGKAEGDHGKQQIRELMRAWDSDDVDVHPEPGYPKNENFLRDRDIDRPEFRGGISSPQIVERLAQLLGPDLLVWRSQIFNKEPGDPSSKWPASVIELTSEGH